MEDKWFIFYEQPWLYLHRSWTGYCIYPIRFEPCTEGMRIVEALVNRDPSQHLENNDDRDVMLLKVILGSCAQRNMKSQMISYIHQQRPDQ